MRYVEKFFLGSIFLKQFYIFQSGGLQIADIFFLVAFCIYIYIKRYFKVRKIDRKIMSFFAFVYFINLTYFFIYQNRGFLSTTMYYLFIIMVIILFRELATSKDFLEKLARVLKINLVIQLVIFFSGMGRYYAESRYMGTFNDPNQMGFSIYISFMLIFLIYNLLRKKLNIIYYIITVFLIMNTSSTGMLFGIASFSVLYIVFKIYKLIKNRKMTIFKISLIIACSIGFSFIIVNKPSNINLNKLEEILSIASGNDKPIIIFDRMEEKLNRENQKQSVLEERGIDKLYKYPFYNLFGAGQGLYSRFKKAAHGGEIHSTLPSILFSYGIIPLIIIIIWGLSNLKKIPLEMSAIYISLILESFTLLNQRQPLFWIIFMVGYLYEFKDKLKSEKEVGCNE